MAQTNARSDGSRSVEQNNVGLGPQVVNNHFHGDTYLTTEHAGPNGITIALGLVMLLAIPFTLAYLPFSIALAVSGLLLLTGIGGRMARALGIRLTATVRNLALIGMVLLNLPLAIAFGREQSRLAEAQHAEIRDEQQARLNDRQRKDSLEMCLQRIDTLHRSGEIGDALLELDKADRVAETPGEKADVNQVRIGISLTKATELMRRHRYNSAIDLLSSVYKLDTSDTDVLYVRARCYVETGQLANAVNDAKKAMSLGHKEAGKLYEEISPLRKQVAYTCTLCRDGTYSNAKGRGACSHHGGVKEWNRPVYDDGQQYE